MAGPLGSTPGIIVGVGVGTAAATALEPAIETPRQDAWHRLPHRVLDPSTMARLVAQGGVTLGEAQEDAQREGYDTDKLDALVYLAQTVPGFGQALELYRRDPKGFGALWTHALVKNGIDARYLPHLNELVDDRLSPPVIALAIVRGIMHDPGFLPVGPPTGTGKVPAFPTSKLDALSEAQAFGFNRDRLFVQTAISGRPMGPEAAASAVFRKIIERVDYDRAIAEGDVRNEWADPIFEQARSILSPIDHVAARLRAWITTEEMHAGAALHGMSAPDADLLLKIHGRPLSWHQVWIGHQRGGVYGVTPPDINAAFLKSLEESDIRPEWYGLAWAQRYNYPSPFVLRAITQAGDITGAEAEQILLFEGWEPTLAAKVSAKWSGGTKTSGKAETKAELADEYEGGYLSAADYRTALQALGYTGAVLELEFNLSDARRLKKWREKVVDAIGKAFLAHDLTDAEATVQLATVNVTGEAASGLIGLWKIEQGVTRRHLTAPQIKRAYRRAILTQAQAMAALEALDYDAATATTYLAE